MQPDVKVREEILGFRNFDSPQGHKNQKGSGYIVLYSSKLSLLIQMSQKHQLLNTLLVNIC